MDITEQTIKWNHLPSIGGYYDQDEYIMTIWECVRQNVYKALKDESLMQTLRGKNGKNQS